MPARRVPLDEDTFVLEHVSGRYTNRALARRHGLSVSLVEKILRGERRAHLKVKIDAAVRVARRRAYRRLAGLVDQAVETLAKLMDGKFRGPAGPALAAAREVLRSILGDERARAEAFAGDAAAICPTCRGMEQTLCELSPGTKRLVLAELGGPPLDEQDEREREQRSREQHPGDEEDRSDDEDPGDEEDEPP